MKRFRFTLLAICLFLIWLGWADVSLLLRNPSPEPVTIASLEAGETPREWLAVTGGFVDLEQAINTSGTVEIDTLLVPLKGSAEAESFRVLVETRDPELVELFTRYHIGIDSVFAKKAFLDEHRDRFHARRDVTGMVVTGLIASGNRDKLLKLAREVGMKVDENALFLSEGKEPARYRGFFYLTAGLLGIGALIRRWKQQPSSAPPAN